MVGTTGSTENRESRRRRPFLACAVILVGMCVTMQAVAAIIWTDSIQAGASPWGFSGLGVEHPIGTTVSPSDANGANLSRVANPLAGGGQAIRHFATFDAGGSRSQAGLYGDVNTLFGDQAKSPEGVWIAQEWYFPQAISAGGDPYCWINLWDWHSVDANRGNRWHTSPGLMLARDGSMRVGWEWGGPAYSINPTSELSSIALPVGRWFDIEMHYVWSSTPSATLSLWIDGQLALQQSGVQTRAATHQIVETYSKFYGSSQGHGPWVPTPSLRYTRNVRIGNARIWQGAPDARRVVIEDATVVEGNGGASEVTFRIRLDSPAPAP